MIFITGDTHRLMDVQKIDIDNFPEQKLLNRNDYLIICGDFGGVWGGEEKDADVLDMHESRNYTTLFVAGNHENYDALNSYPVEMWNGGKIHRIRPHVIHLMNGQVYEIDGSRFFVIPEGRELPVGADKEAIPVYQPVKNIYLADLEDTKARIGTPGPYSRGLIEDFKSVTVFVNRKKCDLRRQNNML